MQREECCQNSVNMREIQLSERCLTGAACPDMLDIVQMKEDMQHEGI